MTSKQFAINTTLKQVRRDYDKGILLEEHCHQDPFQQFENWFTEAYESEGDQANAMCLSTIDNDHVPDSRIVLLRNLSYGGFTFYTNYKSEKGKQLAQNPKGSLLFFWKELQRQIRIQGCIKFLPTQESEDYFNSRPFESQVAAWVSQQREILNNRKTLDETFEIKKQEYKNLRVPKPLHWGGYVLLPHKIEFWQGRPSRLHDRILYTYNPENKSWKINRLMP